MQTFALETKKAVLLSKDRVSTLRERRAGAGWRSGEAGGRGGSSPLCSWTPLAGCAGPPCRAASPPSSAGTSQTRPGPEGGDRNGREMSRYDPSRFAPEQQKGFKGQVCNTVVGDFEE